MTAVSPATITMFFENQYYPTLEEYLGALSDAMRPEYRAIVDAGLTSNRLSGHRLRACAVPRQE